MKQKLPAPAVLGITDQAIVDAAVHRTHAKECDCCVPFLRSKDNKCNVCERAIPNI